MTVPLGITAESPTDTSAITWYVDSRLCNERDWITSSTLDGYRAWLGTGGRSWEDLHGSYRRARDQKKRVFGHFNGEPGEEDAAMFRALFLLFSEEEVPPKVLVVARDLDGRDGRAAGFAQAVRVRDWPFAIVGALAHPEIEAWKIAAWKATGPDDQQRHAEVKREVGFDPVREPERLTSTAGEKKDAKTVRDALYQGADFDVAHWLADPRPPHWKACGLAGFLEEVDQKIVPLF